MAHDRYASADDATKEAIDAAYSAARNELESRGIVCANDDRAESLVAALMRYADASSTTGHAFARRSLLGLDTEPTPSGPETCADFESFVRAYIVAALWSSTDESTPEGGEPMDSNYDADDIAPEDMQIIREECRAFYYAHRAEIAERDAVSAGHDFWLTRNWHGAGFWDGDWPEPAASKLDAASKAAGERTLYIGDDGKVYMMTG